MLKRECNDIPDTFDRRHTTGTSKTFRDYDDNPTVPIYSMLKRLMEWREAKELLTSIFIKP